MSGLLCPHGGSGGSLDSHLRFWATPSLLGAPHALTVHKPAPVPPGFGRLHHFHDAAALGSPMCL